VLNIKPVISKVVFYDDVWKKAYRREDAAKTHIGGTPNVSYEIIAQKNEVMENGNEKELQALFDDNLGKFPLYYSTPSLREYIAMEGQYEVNINIDAELYSMLQEQIQTNNLCYLGNSEGWIDLKFKKI
ncbi:MAG: type I-PGING CRISPR-associated protein Cas5p, partial [Prevotellaceae bacterium]|jgi:CRISPR-associated protein Cas5|nr:type I-PGING CRISPR-associated protein Cas5p [Prevotellaceae bacterium]